MTEETLMQLLADGADDGADESEDKPDETDSESSTEDNEDEDSSDASGDDKKEDEEDNDVPFHRHPRWTQREEEWNRKFNDQETRHQEDLRSIREEFGNKRKENADQVEKPSWFGGSDEQWQAYRKDRDAELKQAQESAIKGVTEAKSAEEKAVKEATDYMQSEMAAIEKDKTLNPTGAKVDPNKLLKIVMDNDLVDSKGRWNYRAGFRILQKEATKPAQGAARKPLAAASTSDNRAETKPPAFKTSKDFLKNRPW